MQSRRQGRSHGRRLDIDVACACALELSERLRRMLCDLIVDFFRWFREKLTIEWKKINSRRIGSWIGGQTSGMKRLTFIFSVKSKTTKLDEKFRMESIFLRQYSRFSYCHSAQETSAYRSCNCCIGKFYSVIDEKASVQIHDSTLSQEQFWNSRFAVW
jgi:hypothetical protein